MPSFFQKLKIYIKQSFNRGYWLEVAAKKIEELLDNKCEEFQLSDPKMGEVLSGLGYFVVLLGKDVYDNQMVRLAPVDYATAVACLRYRRNFRVGNNLSVVNVHTQTDRQRLRVLLNRSDMELGVVQIDLTYGDNGLYFTEQLKPIRGLL